MTAEAVLSQAGDGIPRCTQLAVGVGSGSQAGGWSPELNAVISQRRGWSPEVNAFPCQGRELFSGSSKLHSYLSAQRAFSGSGVEPQGEHICLSA